MNAAVVVATYDQIGVLVAQSTNSSFDAAVAGAGVEAVAVGGDRGDVEAEVPGVLAELVEAAAEGVVRRR